MSHQLRKSNKPKRDRTKGRYALVVKRVIDERGRYDETQIEIESKKLLDLLLGINDDVEGCSLSKVSSTLLGSGTYRVVLWDLSDLITYISLRDTVVSHQNSYFTPMMPSGRLCGAKKVARIRMRRSYTTSRAPFTSSRLTKVLAFVNWRHLWRRKK